MHPGTPARLPPRGRLAGFHLLRRALNLMYQGASRSGTLGHMVKRESFSIGEVASMVGVSAHTLRAWERRYSVITPVRTLKNQRRYSADDVRFLTQLTATCQDGVRSVKAAAMTVRGMLPETADLAATDMTDGKSMWRDVLDRSRDLMLILDVRGRIVDANRALAEAVGRTREGLQGRRLSTLVVNDDRPTLGRGAAPPFKPIDDLALRLKTPTTHRHVAFDGRPIRQADGWLFVMIGRPLAEAA
jgi:DNA-binding transcriptional MerR regulator